MRTQAREAVLKLLFSKLFDNKADDETINIIFDELKLNEEDRSFAKLIYNNAIENFEIYYNSIADLSKSYSITRIFNVDKCAMISAMSEMNCSDVPKVVTIDEAVKLVKKYSTENSVNFVNGILASYKNNTEVSKVD